ncbi:MAG TPA: guanylate kinase [Paludibacteraceae bacterium]|nr:guanylate kinase [Paludibacteraceae bacterium]HOL00194.1 guanylate kinase [Paludibacteraceae bacterium]HPO67384.1 guanylate kinase [Paludibacteraceae bacterium]HRR63164.1 guanylate kinase [Paludibacteraceae bacterium]
MAGKLIILSAPSGAGKSTLVHHLLNSNLNLEFSVSATSRAPRLNEKEGIDYYFLTPEEFKQKIANGEFLEYEEVYPDCFYGTLRSEIDRITQKDKNVIFDVDVKGGLNIKRQFGNQALAIFIAPPNMEALKERLLKRGTETPEMIQKRIEKAAYEMSFAPQFDKIIINDDLEKAKKEIEETVRDFLNK